MSSGPQWTDDDDERLRLLVDKHGPRKWAVVARALKTKTSKQVTIASSSRFQAPHSVRHSRDTCAVRTVERLLKSGLTTTVAAFSASRAACPYSQAVWCHDHQHAPPQLPSRYTKIVTHMTTC